MQKTSSFFAKKPIKISEKLIFMQKTSSFFAKNQSKIDFYAKN